MSRGYRELNATALGTGPAATHGTMRERSVPVPGGRIATALGLVPAVPRSGRAFVVRGQTHSWKQKHTMAIASVVSHIIDVERTGRALSAGRPAQDRTATGVR
jgi:hypothetical protein